MTKYSLQRTLFIAAAVGTAVAAAASAAHMVSALSWAHGGGVAGALAVVLVILSAVCVVLAVISPSGRPRLAIMTVNVGLLLMEWAGNMAVGVIKIETEMPLAVGSIFHLTRPAAEWVFGLLLSGNMPFFVFLLVYALSKTAQELFVPRAPNALATRVLEEPGFQEILVANGARDGQGNNHREEFA